MSAITPPAKEQILQLYRQFLRASIKFNNYNFRSYFIRRSRDSFKEYISVTEPEEIHNLLSKARAELQVLQRQSKISQMYSFDKLVVEPLDRHHRNLNDTKEGGK